MADLLSALAPQQARAEDARASSDSLGVAPLLLAAGKGIQAGLKWIKSPKGKRFLKKLTGAAGKADWRRKLYQARADRARDPKAKARWQRRADRQQRRLDDVRITKMLAEKGLVKRGPVLEYKRNLLAMEWEDASPARKEQIEKRIARMDRRLKKLHHEKTLLERTLAPPKASKPAPKPAPKRAPKPKDSKVSGVGDGGSGPDPRKLERDVFESVSESYVPWGRSKRKLSELPPVQRALVRSDKMIVSGMGANRYAVQAPPGAGRLVRIPFYPANDNFSWSGSNGIDFKNDDPVATLVIDQSVSPRAARPLQLATERFDYGSYRILGFQVNEQGNTKPQVGFSIGQLNLGGIIVAFRNLQLYNGQTLFLQENGIWSANFDVFPGSYRTDSLGNASNSARLQLPGVYERRRSRWFAGLRDYPVVSGTTFVSVEVAAFSVFPASVEDPIWEIPITCNVIGEMVEDKVFGDVVNPGPAARGGAMVKAAAREVGTSAQGRPQLELVAARHRRTKTE